MRDVILIAVALLAVSLGITVWILWRQVTSQSQRTAQRRAETLVEVRKALLPEEHKERKRRHLRIVPIILGGAAAAIGWIAKHPTPAAAAGAAAASAAVTAALVIATGPSEPRPIDALPDQAPTVANSAPSATDPTTTTTTSSTSAPAAPTDRAAVERSAPARPSRLPRTTQPATTSTTTTPPIDTTSTSGPDDEPDNTAPVDCVVRVEALGLIDLCVPALRVSLLLL